MRLNKYVLEFPVAIADLLRAEDTDSFHLPQEARWVRREERIFSSVTQYSQNLMEHGVMARVYGVASVHVASAQEGRLCGDIA